MTASPWLPACVAALMLVIAALCAARLISALLNRRPGEPEANAVHVLMGVAMAGMLVPRLNALPSAMWLAVFGAAAIWFGWRAIRKRVQQSPAGLHWAHPAPHAVECAAMFYMLWPARPVGHDHATRMPGMSAPAPAPNAALALVLTLFMLGYVLWTTDQLATAARSRRHTSSGRKPASVAGTSEAAATGEAGNAGVATIPVAVLAAVSKIAMSVAMSYMLIAML